MTDPKRTENRRPDPLKRISRSNWQKAFGRTDDEFHDRVRQTLFLIEEKEEEPVKKKMTFSMALAFALCLCLAAGAFAGSLLGSKNPDVTNTPLSQGESAKPAPMPTTTPIMVRSTPVPDFSDYVYVLQNELMLYHFTDDCSRIYEIPQQIIRLRVMTESDALTNGYQRCNACAYLADPNATPIPRPTSETEFIPFKTPMPTLTKSPSYTTEQSVYVVFDSDMKYHYSLETCFQLPFESVIWEVMSEQAAINTGYTACTDCIYSVYGTPQPTPAPVPTSYPEFEYVWSAEGDEAYHSIRECFAAHQGVVRVIPAVAYNRRQSPCPYCIFPAYDNATPLPTLATIPPKSTPQTDTDVYYVYYTRDGINYHTVPDCSGMRNAVAGTIAEALNLNKTACTVCTMVQPTPQPTPQSLRDDEIVYMTDYNGRYFHFDQACMNMSGAYYNTLAYAQENGFKPCPLCVWNMPESYLVEGGVYFHVKEDCIPDGHAYECGYHDLKALLELGRTPCPMCYEPSSEDIRYWQIDKDTVYHASLECTHTHMPVGSSDTLSNVLEILDHSFLIDSSLTPCPDCVLAEPIIEQKSGIPSDNIPTFLDDQSFEVLDAPKGMVFTARGFGEGDVSFSGVGPLFPVVQGNDHLTIRSIVMTLARGSLYLEVEFVVDNPDFLPASVRIIPYSETEGAMEVKYADVREFTYENGETGYLLCQLTDSPSDNYGADHFRIYAVENGFYEHIADFK